MQSPHFYTRSSGMAQILSGLTQLNANFITVPARAA